DASTAALRVPCADENAHIIRIDASRVRSDVQRNLAARAIPAWLLSLIVSIVLILPAAAGAAPGALRGHVRDASGSPLPGAIVGLHVVASKSDSTAGATTS